MTPSEIAAHLSNPNLLQDITYPGPRKAAKLAAVYLLDLDEIAFAAELVLANPEDRVARDLLAACINNYRGRAAA